MKIIKQNSFTSSLLLDEDRIDKETVMHHIYGVTELYEKLLGDSDSWVH